MNKSGMTQIGRLAFREEGDWWNAYYAMPDTMVGALHIGAIKKTAVGRSNVKSMFLKTMREVVSDILEEATGQRPQWNDPQVAPEHERAGHS